MGFLSRFIEIDTNTDAASTQHVLENFYEDQKTVSSHIWIHIGAPVNGD